MSITIRVNGEEKSLNSSCTVSDFLTGLGLGDRKAIAVALNGTVVPRDQYDCTSIGNEDTLEIVRAIGGGF
jgi:sulfur carrier protein